MDHEELNQIEATKKQKKTADRKAYMREYMKQYNAKKPKRQKLTDTEKCQRLRESQKRYYEANRQTILKQKFNKAKDNKIQKLKDKLKLLEL
jgi:hypothetical protein